MGTEHRVLVAAGEAAALGTRESQGTTRYGILAGMVILDGNGGFASQLGWHSSMPGIIIRAA